MQTGARERFSFTNRAKDFGHDDLDPIVGVHLRSDDAACCVLVRHRRQPTHRRSLWLLWLLWLLGERWLGGVCRDGRRERYGRHGWLGRDRRRRWERWLGWKTRPL